MLADNVIGSCHDGTIHKLVIVRILLNEAEAEMWRKEPRERAADDSIDDVVGDCRIGHALYDFLIFIHNVISHAQLIFALTKRLPCRAVGAMHRQHLHQTIGVQYHYSFHCL